MLVPVPPPNHPLACRVVSAHTGATIADVKSVIGRGEVNDVCIIRPATAPSSLFARTSGRSSPATARRYGR